MKHRDSFPLLKNSNITYLDNGATTQKPFAVLEAMDVFYKTQNANVHRGVYKLADEATKAYEDARHVIASFIGCKDAEVIFTSGTTHSMNLAAHIIEQLVVPGTEVLVTVAEHHSTFLPFQQLAKLKNATFVVVPLEHGTITEEHLNSFITEKTAVIAIAMASNVLGYSLDLGKIKKKNALLIVDAAQSVAHEPISLKHADLLAFSGHKVYGPMGVGVLAGKHATLARGEPLLLGGSMIETVTTQQSTWAAPPGRYEAGTPNVAGAVGLAAALTYLKPLREKAGAHELALAQKADALIRTYATVLGPKKRSAPIVSFIMERVHAHDVAQILDSFDVCVRAGQHCCQPLHEALGVDASVRVSFARYNTKEDLARLEEGLKQVRKVFS